MTKKQLATPKERVARTKKKLPKLGFEDLEVFVGGLELQSILLASIDAKRSPVELSPNLVASFDQDMKGHVDPSGVLVYEVKHRLEISSKEIQAYSVEFVHIATYSSKFTDVSPELTQRFGEESVRVTLAPFSRELILRLTADAGLPPLLVGLAKRNLNVPDKNPE